jgi:hypothetical protein
MRLNYSYDLSVDKAYIIRVDGNDTSETLAERCADSCREVGQEFVFWGAYDGYKNPIQPPAHHSEVLNLVKVTDHYMTRGEVACALSHISLWNHCAQIDRPIVVLEHDAIMLKPYFQHGVYNSICYLGAIEQHEQGWQVLPTPPHSSDGPNYHFICRAHAYAIDPCVAKNLLAHVIKYGICAPLDILMRADLFPMHQMGMYAYDKSDKTTILNRPAQGRTTQRNDELTI